MLFCWRKESCVLSFFTIMRVALLHEGNACAFTFYHHSNDVIAKRRFMHQCIMLLQEFCRLECRCIVLKVTLQLGALLCSVENNPHWRKPTCHIIFMHCVWCVYAPCWGRLVHGIIAMQHDVEANQYPFAFSGAPCNNPTFRTPS